MALARATAGIGPLRLVSRSIFARHIRTSPLPEPLLLDDQQSSKSPFPGLATPRQVNPMGTALVSICLNHHCSACKVSGSVCCRSGECQESAFCCVRSSGISFYFKQRNVFVVACSITTPALAQTSPTRFFLRRTFISEATLLSWKIICLVCLNITPCNCDIDHC
jgi:hypothetical protein